MFRVVQGGGGSSIASVKWTAAKITSAKCSQFRIKRDQNVIQCMFLCECRLLNESIEHRPRKNLRAHVI